MKHRFTRLFSLLLMAAMSMGAMADTAIVSWTTSNQQGANSITGVASSGLAGWTLAITGNTSKSWSAGNGDITFSEVTYKTLKNSNGAENTFTLPTGYNASKVDFYVVTNDNSTAGKLSNFNGVSCDHTVSSLKDYSNPTHIEKTLATPANSFSFTFGTKQVCFIMVVTYSGSAGGGEDPGEDPGDEPDPDAPTTGTINDLVTIDGEFTFEPTATLTDKTLYKGKKIISLGGSGYNNGVQIKSSRQLAFKVAAGAKIVVTFNENGTRAMQIGTSSAGTELASSATSPVTANRTTAGIVYISASSDLYLTKLEISYPTFYTITYNYNGGTLKDGESDITESAKETGETFTVASAAVLDAPDGKEFDKWNDGSADYAQGATYTVGTANVTLTAQWRNETTKYAVTYDLGDYTAGVAPTETDKSEGSVFAIKAAPERASYDFLGWLCDIDSKNYKAGDNYTMTAANTKFTAQWQAFFTITYKDGDETLGTEKVNAGDSPTGIADPTKELYSFVGWTEVQDGNVLVDPTSLSASTTLFAKWEAFDGCAYLAVDLTADATLSVGDNVALKDVSFGGSVKVAGMKTTGDKASIVYDGYGLYLKGGNADSLRVSIDHQLQVGSKITVALYTGNTGTRGLNLLNKNCGAVDDGTMLGWESATAGASGTFSYTVKADDGLDGEKMFHLQRNNSVYLMYITVENCAPQDFTVTYKDGSSTLGTEFVFENEHPTASGITTGKSGYVFEGWAETDGGSVVDLDDITITADKTFYAVYTERTLTSVTLEDMNLKAGDTGTPAMTLNPEGALVTSEVWAITASTATGTTIDENTGEITAGETAGQLTVQVTINGDKVASCTVTVVPGYESAQPVSETTTWQWDGVLDENTNIAGTDTVLANYYGGAQWEKIAGKQGDYAYRAESHNCYQGTYLYFKATIPGILTIYARYASACALNVNGTKVRQEMYLLHPRLECVLSP